MKKYSVIYADPPWSFSNKKTGGSMKSGAAAQYDTMSIEQLKALDVPEICADDCALIMWYVGSQPQEAIDLCKAWGFTIKNMNGFIWVKLTEMFLQFFGMGFWTRASAECAIIATRGKPKRASAAVRQVRLAVIGRHSEKPAEFRADIEKLCGDGNKLEMFARQSAPGWDVFGNQVENSITINSKE